jgi:hypothetical protein
MVTKKNKMEVGRIFLFDNDDTGRLAIKLMRKALNRGRYDIKVRGRGPNRYLYRNYDHDIPLPSATQLAVYVYTNRATRHRAYDREQERLGRVNNWENELTR